MPDHITPTRSHGLVEILDRVLDKGLVIAGDIKINLANVELLSIHVRLLVCSIDKAEQIGLNWWRHDPRLTASGPGSIAALGASDADALASRLDRIEQRLAELAEGGTGGTTAGSKAPRAASKRSSSTE